MSTPASVELVCTPDEAAKFRSQRLNSDANYTEYPVSKLSVDPSTIYEQIRLAETYLVPAEDYENGSARYDNEILLLPGEDLVLLTAEHATNQKRQDKTTGERVNKSYDAGTGGLVYSLASSIGSTALIAIGRQTGDANNDLTHPFKDHMTEIISKPFSRAHLSAHGMSGGAAANLTDERGFKVMVGIGDKPSGATKALTDYILQIASDYDMRVGINQPQLRFDSKTKLPLLDDTGRVQRITFSGAGATTTRSHAQRVAEENGKGDSFATVQLELSTSVRLLSSNFKTYRSKRDAEIGAALGYLFMRDAIKSVSKL